MTHHHLQFFTSATSRCDTIPRDPVSLFLVSMGGIDLDYDPICGSMAIGMSPRTKKKQRRINWVMTLLNLQDESGNSDISVDESVSEYLLGDEEQESTDYEYVREGGKGSALGEGSAALGEGGEEGAVLHDESDFSGEGGDDDDMGEGSFGGVGGDVGDGESGDCVWCHVVHRGRAVKHVAKGRKTHRGGVWSRMWGEWGIMGVVGGW